MKKKWNLAIAFFEEGKRRMKKIMAVRKKIIELPISFWHQKFVREKAGSLGNFKGLNYKALVSLVSERLSVLGF